MTIFPSRLSPQTRVLAIIAALVLSAPAAAALYKSVGPDGKVTYSDKPPMTPQSQSRETTEQMRDVPPPADADAAKNLSKQEADFQRRVNERQADEKKAAEDRSKAADLNRRCQDARTQINQYRDATMTLYRAGDKPGERAALDMDTRMKEAARLEEDMKKAGCP